MTKQQALEAELNAGEALVWSEEPDTFAYISIKTFYPITFVFWIFFVAIISRKPDTPDNWDFFKWMPIIVGTLCLAGILWDLVKPIFMLYAITDQRLLIVQKYPFNISIESYYSRHIAFTRKRRRRNGSGSIVFTRTSEATSKGHVFHKDVGFFGIDNVDSVETTIKGLFLKSIPSPQPS